MVFDRNRNRQVWNPKCWEVSSGLKVRGEQLETVGWDQSRVCFLEAEISYYQYASFSISSVVNFPKVKERKRGREEEQTRDRGGILMSRHSYPQAVKPPFKETL